MLCNIGFPTNATARFIYLPTNIIILFVRINGTDRVIFWYIAGVTFI